MNDELKPCPFCGGKAFVQAPNMHHQTCAVCKNCGIFTAWGTPEEAASAWNSRTPSGCSIVANKTEDYNPPLTMEKLRRMDGEPVYVVFDQDADGERLKMWVLVDADYDDGDVCLENNIGGRTVFCCNEELNGMTLYRRKPEEN